MHKVLIVDDEESVRYSFKKLLRPPVYQVLEAKNGNEALAKFEEFSPNLVILDIQMPGFSGLDVLKRIKAISPKTCVLVITAYGTTERVITAMKYGAYEYIEKPFDIPRMKSLIDEVLEAGRIMRTEVHLAVKDNNPVDRSADCFVGSSTAIQEVYKMIGRVAAQDVNVLLMGESGTGKELVARAIYQHSKRADKPFLAVNCAAIPETLLESELFGYEKGAFTGAVKRKIGKFQQADSGTLFLDEIGDMSMTTQAKILRLLQESTFERLGGDETIHSDVRIIAATNKNLEELIAQNKFREDLFYRIKVITIGLPPLRKRKEDIPELIDYFIAKHCVLLNKDRISLTPESVRFMNEHDWPGNVRELENVLKRAILLCKGDVITTEIIADDLQVKSTSSDIACRLELLMSDNLHGYEGRLYETVISQVERELIIKILRRVNGNQVQAAKLLGISRVMLHDRIKKYDIKTDVIIWET